MRILITLGLSIIGAILYRWGGQGKPFNTRYRDLGVPLCGIGILLTWWQPVNTLGWLMLIPHFGLAFASMTTYWDWLTKLWRKDESEYWENWLLTGFFYGLSAFPLMWVNIHWYSIIIRAIILGILIMLIRENTKKDIIEEIGSGLVYLITIPLLFI